MSVPPTTTALVVSTAIVSLLTGYLLGTGASLGLFGASSRRERSRLGHSATKGNDASESESDLEDDGEDDEDDIGKGDVVDFEAEEEYKMVLVVRTDLGMNKGKIAAQCSHATLGAFSTHLNSSQNSEAPATITTSVFRHTPYPYSTSPTLSRWYASGQAKITVQCKSEAELLELQATAREIGLVGSVIRDAGRTQIAAGSATVLAVGPGPASVVNAVTGHLKLL